MRSMLDDGEVNADELARQLGVSRSEVDGYIAGDHVMPLSRQLSLANFVIAKSAKRRRQGHALLAQVSAATNFHAKKTPTHSGPPPRWTDPRRRS